MLPRVRLCAPQNESRNAELLSKWERFESWHKDPPKFTPAVFPVAATQISSAIPAYQSTEENY